MLDITVIIMIGLIFLVLFTLLPRIQKHLKTMKNLRKLDLPTIKGNYFIGIGLQLANNFMPPAGMSLGNYVCSTVNGICVVFRKQGMFKLDLGFVLPIVIIYRSDIVEELLTKCHRKSGEYSFASPVLGEGLLTSKPIKWKKDRKMLKTAFNPRILLRFQPLLNRKASILINNVKKILNEDMSHLKKLFEIYSVDCVFETSLGCTVKEIGAASNKITESFNCISVWILGRATKPWYWLDFINYLTPKGREYLKHLHYVNFVAKKIYIEKKKKMDDVKRGISIPVHEKRCMSFLDLLFNATIEDDSITKKDIMDHIKSLLFAGFDITANLMTWVVYFMGVYEDVQRKAYQEIDFLFRNNSEGETTAEDLKAMTYLDAVIKETMRIVPIAPIFGRNLEDDLTLGGQEIPMGTDVFINLWALHRDPNVFPNPEVFDPNRFLDFNLGANQFAYLPFSGGPRRCLGFPFAMQEVKTALSEMLRNFQWKALEPRDVNCPEMNKVTVLPRFLEVVSMKERATCL